MCICGMTEHSENLITIKDLRSRYDKNITLKNLSLEIPSGSLVSLIGPNGSGKTTLLRVLAGLKGYAGTLLLEGREVRNISRKNFARCVSVLMSDKNFRPSYPFSVREIIAMGRLPFRGIFTRLDDHDHELIAKSADMVGISHILSRDVVTLSDGERQLVFLACVLAQDTRILLLDEPTNSLDPDKSAKVFKLLRGLVNSGRSIIAAVHDINISLAYSDYYIALKNGELLSHGRIDDLSGDVLENLYNSRFEAYRNQNRNDLMWRAVNE